MVLTPQFLCCLGTLTAYREKQYPGHRLRSILPLMSNGGFIDLAHSGGCFGVPFRFHYCIAHVSLRILVRTPFLAHPEFSICSISSAVCTLPIEVNPVHQTSSCPLLYLHASKVLCASSPVEHRRSSVYPSQSLAPPSWHYRRSRVSLLCSATSAGPVSEPSIVQPVSRPFLFPVLLQTFLHTFRDHGAN